jgi:hypothetical protein
MNWNELEYSGNTYGSLMFSLRDFHNRCNDYFLSYALSYTKQVYHTTEKFLHPRLSFECVANNSSPYEGTRTYAEPM